MNHHANVCNVIILLLGLTSFKSEPNSLSTEDEAAEPIFVNISPGSSSIGEKRSEEECIAFSKLFTLVSKLARFPGQRVSAYTDH